MNVEEGNNGLIKKTIEKYILCVFHIVTLFVLNINVIVQLEVMSSL